MNKKYYKKYIEKLINTNPTTITITRKVETDDGFGGTTITEETVTETVTFYNRRARREVVSDYGKSYVGVQVTKILARNDADIVEGDTFKADREYKVIFVNSYMDICKQIELDVIA